MKKQKKEQIRLIIAIDKETKEAKDLLKKNGFNISSLLRKCLIEEAAKLN